jgi:hypothetical protein
MKTAILIDGGFFIRRYKSLRAFMDQDQNLGTSHHLVFNTIFSLPLFGLIQKVRKKIKTSNSIPFADLTPKDHSSLQAKGFLRILPHDA